MNSFASRAVLTSGNCTYTIYSLPALAERLQPQPVALQPEDSA
jgi:hypothetical protein